LPIAGLTCPILCAAHKIARGGFHSRPRGVAIDFVAIQWRGVADLHDAFHAIGGARRAMEAVAPRPHQAGAARLGGWGVCAGVVAIRSIRPVAGPNGSVWMREASIPRTPIPALISSAGACLLSRMNAPRGAAISRCCDLELVTVETGVQIAAGDAPRSR